MKWRICRCLVSFNPGSHAPKLTVSLIAGMPTSAPNQGLQRPAYGWKLTNSGPRPSYGASMDRSASYAGGYGSTGGYGT